MLSLVGLALAANGVAAGLGMKRWYIGVVIVGLLLLIGGADLD